jgi:uncharacterized membrane protein (GlpM family)
MPSVFRVALAFAAAGHLFPALPAAAQNSPRKDMAAPQEGGQAQIQFYIVQQSLVSAFETLGTLGNVSVQADPAIDKVVSGIMLRGGMAEVVAQLARLHGLFYWFDGIRFIIAPSTALGRWVISAGNMDDAAIAQMLAAVAPVLPPDAARFDPQGRMLHVSGTRELKEAIELAVDAGGRDRPGGISVIRHGVAQR